MYNSTTNSHNSDHVVVVLTSDTKTRPTPVMRKAMYEAEVGDDVCGEDPTVNKLEELAAKILGKEAGMFVPSATMSNLIAVMSHCQHRGMEALVGDQSHQMLYEQGGIAQLAGVNPRTLSNNADGTFDLNELRNKIRGDDVHEPITGVICVENTHNRCGGKVLPLDFLSQVARIAKEHGLPVHMDGARIMNSAVYLKETPARVARDVNSVTVCLSKGLGCPVGAVLVGNVDFINRARRARKALGGGMRQAGVIAAAGIVALESMVERLEEDHKHARMIAEAIVGCKAPGISVDSGVQTNILLINVTSESGWTAEKFCDRLSKVTDEEKQATGVSVEVQMWPFTATEVRLIVHFDVTPELIKLAINKMVYVIQQIKSGIPPA